MPSRSRRAPRPRATAPGLRVELIPGRPRAARAPGRGLARWLRRAAPWGAAGDVTIVLTSDARIRALNRRYRHKDRVTDVLSFPASSAGPGTQHPATGSWPPAPGPPLILGDVVIAIDRARRQARDAGHSLETELRILALHGLLHLLGFDHEDDDGRMARLERTLRRKAGVREGLIERAGGAGGAR